MDHKELLGAFIDWLDNEGFVTHQDDDTGDQRDHETLVNDFCDWWDQEHGPGSGATHGEKVAD